MEPGPELPPILPADLMIAHTIGIIAKAATEATPRRPRAERFHREAAPQQTTRDERVQQAGDFLANLDKMLA